MDKKKRWTKLVNRQGIPKEMENIKWQTWNSTAENTISEKKKWLDSI